MPNRTRLSKVVSAARWLSAHVLYFVGERRVLVGFAEKQIRYGWGHAASTFEMYH